MSVSEPSFSDDDPIQLIIPASAPRKPNAFLAKLGRWGLRRLGWKVRGGFVDSSKIIAIFAPHSSNWDWIIGVLALWGLELKFSYMIKDSAFIWPLSIIIRRTGGIAIDRSAPGDVVEQISQEFDKTDQLYFALTPEGTRKKVKKWKTGFLRLAYKTQVPVIPVSIDYPKKEILVPDAIELSGDIDTDMEKIQAYYQPFRGRY